jgi:hypothetical protein
MSLSNSFPNFGGGGAVLEFAASADEDEGEKLQDSGDSIIGSPAPRPDSETKLDW